MSERTATLDQETVNNFVIAAHFDAPRVKAMLAEEPALLNASAPWDETAIQAASQMGNREIMEHLLAAGAPQDIFTAAAMGRAGEVERLLSQDPALAHGSGVHSLPIMYFAAVGGNPAIAQMLFDSGAEVDPGVGGQTSLHGAAAMGHLEMA